MRTVIHQDYHPHALSASLFTEEEEILKHGKKKEVNGR